MLTGYQGKDQINCKVTGCDKECRVCTISVKYWINGWRKNIIDLLCMGEVKKFEGKLPMNGQLVQ